MTEQRKNPYEVIYSRYATEKTTVLENLKNSESNKCVARCESPKYVFLVDKFANKTEIAKAVQSIYSEENIKVLAVNTITVKAKPKARRGKYRAGKTKAVKKAIVTLEKGDSLDNV